ncbi:MAG: CxxxxCH/CxxCH domain-containing protein, partial [Desulfuromonadales bacterium]|nr:CxxxxCH/CxxCH domain-containing protein [Desulfuromonadales bacterium]
TSASISPDAGAVNDGNAGDCTVYCHGANMPSGDTSGSNRIPDWTDSLAGTCDPCHGAPPTAGTSAGTHSGKAFPGSCITCHGSTVLNTNNPPTLDPAFHINGTVEATGCTGCHGTDPKEYPPISPPSGGADGEGAHVKHIEATASVLTKEAIGGEADLVGYWCAECHTTTRGETNHDTDGYPAEVAFTNAIEAKYSGTSASFSAAGGGSSGPSDGTGGSCTVYCHGANMPNSNNGDNTTPAWTDTSTGCSFCHGAPPNSGGHGGSETLTQCSGCHPDTVDGTGAISDNTKHIDGTVQVSASCTGCHNGGGPGAKLISADSPHSETSTGFSCEDCHTGHTGGTILIANNATVGINYQDGVNGYTGDNGINLGGTGTTGSTEQQICNNCHAATYQPWNVTQGNYTTGTLSNYSNWAAASWTSANFSSYKPNTIQSNHYDQAAGMKCSYCHDVHDTYGPNTGVGGPYLRGNWTSNPFPEDGAPNTADGHVGGVLFTEVADGVPRGLGGGNTGSSNALGGWQIEQNNPGAYTNGQTYTQHSGLCELCHPGDTSASGILRGASFSGHAAAVDGLQAGGGNDIFNDGIRGGTSSYARGYMQHNGVTTRGDGNYIYGLRQGRDAKVGAGIYPQVNDPQYANVLTSWGITIGPSSTNVDQDFHEFPCSKCHSPHMSALPRLMITNCLDVSHNTWDDNVADPVTNWGGWNITPTYTASTLAYSPTAANCHRYVKSGDTNQEDNNGTGGNGEPGWNIVTPW